MQRVQKMRIFPVGQSLRAQAETTRYITLIHSGLKRQKRAG